VLNAGIYSHELAQVALFLEKHESALSGPFLRGVEELGLNPPKDEDGMIWYLLRQYIGEMVEGKISPERGGARIFEEVDLHFNLYEKIKRYVGDSHGYQNIIGLYHAYDDVRPERFPEVDLALIEACREWMREYGGVERSSLNHRKDP
jgi:hypothetical protein